MNKKQFTLVEIMITVAISSIIFVVLMSLVLNVSILVRDIYADQVLNSYVRYTRYAIQNGFGVNGGINSALNDFEIEGSTKIKYESGRSQSYTIKGGFTGTLDEEVIETKSTKNQLIFNNESLLIPTITVAKSEATKNDVGNTKELVLKYYLTRKIWGKTYQTGAIIRTTTK